MLNTSCSNFTHSTDSPEETSSHLNQIYEDTLVLLQSKVAQSYTTLNYQSSCGCQTALSILSPVSCCLPPGSGAVPQAESTTSLITPKTMMSQLIILYYNIVILTSLWSLKHCGLFSS